MAIVVFTSNPNDLLERIYEKIEDGDIVTWEKDADGDLTHCAASGQWRNRAWLRPIVNDESLRFHILGVAGAVMKSAVYGVYHGRFIEMLLTHFDDAFEHALATSQPIDGDNVNPDG